MQNTRNLTRIDCLRIFIAVLVLVVLLEVIGYQGVGRWLFGYLWESSTRHEFVIHAAWLMVVNVPVAYGLIIRQFKAERRYAKEVSDWQEEFQSLFYHNTEGVVSFDTHGNITNANPAAEQMTGYSLQEFRVLHRRGFLPEDRKARAEEYFQRALAGEPQEFENTLTHKDGHTIHVQSRNIPIFHGGRVVGVYAILRNVTEYKEYENRIWNLAHYDQLTGLANRYQFYLSADRAIARATEQASSLGVLLVDLDRFKNINDNLGHDTGDKVLISIAKRMASCVQNENVLARMGGDEFALIVPDMNDDEQAKILANCLQNAISRPLTVENYEFCLTASIGISVYPDNGESVTSLLKAADTAMYDAKRLGKATTCVYESVSNEDSYRNLRLESDLRRALDGQSEELYVEYQPQVSIETGEVVGAEALARWLHPTLGSIEPLEFIALAEETGLISALGKHVTQVVCQQIVKWQEQNPSFSLPISLNVSLIQLQDVDFVSDLVRVFDEYHVPTSCIRIEVTESSLSQDERLMVQQLALLRKSGFQIFVDDFGKGYSSFASLKKFSLDGLKIDKYFIDSIDQDNDDALIVETLIKLASVLRLQVIAEGVERDQQVEMLTQFGCDQYQGYIHSRPLKSEDFTNAICSSKERRAVP